MMVSYACSVPYIIFSGGMPADRVMRVPSITVRHRGMTVLEMEHSIVDFITLCSTPWDDGTRLLPEHSSHA